MSPDPTPPAPAPLYSIIVPLPDDDGRPRACVESWARGQTLPRSQVQLVVVTNRRRFGDRAAIAALLESRDLLLDVDSSNLFALYHAGVLRAEGRTLVFTEPHCTAEPGCLAELDRYLAGEACAGAALHSEGESTHWLARLEERSQAEEMAERLRPGDWRKVNVRGFALERDVYHAAGGFEPRYVHFAGWELAARLHRQGYRLGHAERAVVRRRDDAACLPKLVTGIRRFVEGEDRFRSDHREEEVSPYFGRAPALAGGRPASLARVAWQWALARRQLRRLARKLGRRRGDPERSFRAFQEFNAAAVQVARMELLARDRLDRRRKEGPCE